jgi:flavin-dependent dehydrogenase
VSDPLPFYDVVVIGAGPAGISSAMRLHRAGLSVCVLERARFPRFVIGESLLPRCRDLLEECGLLEAVEAKGYFVKKGAGFLQDEARAEFSFAEQFSTGSSFAWHVRRADFDKLLAESAEAAGVSVFYETSVTHAESGEQPSVRCTGPEGKSQTIKTRWIIDASGYGRVLARLFDLDRPSDFPTRRALFTHLECEGVSAVAEAGQTWALSIAKNAWAWLIPFSEQEASFGIVGDLDFFAGKADDPETCLREIIASSPLLGRYLSAAQMLMAPKKIDAYSASVSKLWGPGYTLVGNSADFLDPIFSSGVTVALESAHRATDLLAQQLAGAEVDWEQDYAEYIGRGVDVFRHYIQSWYRGELFDIFFSSQQEPSIKQQICSVLAGYAWDRANPFVRSPQRKLAQVRRLVLDAQ